MDRKIFLKAVGLSTAGLLLHPSIIWASSNNVSLEFQDGDIVMFLGDSITHNGRWHTFVRNFYLTRYPERKILFINCGVSGDNTTNVLQRMEENILIHKPTKVVIMLGMNNSGSQVYLDKKSNTEIETERLRLCKIFLDDMHKIVDKLTANSQPKFIFVSPTIYDETAKLNQIPTIGKNETLQQITEIVRELTREKKATFIDFFYPMMQLNSKLQINNPTYTIIGNDRVHPALAGHQLMAYYFLKNQNVTPIVSSININWKTPRKSKTTKATISNFSKQNDQLEFECIEKNLPYPIGEDAVELLKWVPLHQQLNQQIIQCKHLPSGKFLLAINGSTIGNYTSEELRKGVNIADKNSTPQYKQAQNLYSKSFEVAVKNSIKRSLFQVKKMLLGDNIDAKDENAVKEYAVKMNKINIYYGRIINEFIQYANKLTELDKEIDNLNKEINVLTQASPYTYSIKHLNT